MIGPIRDPRYHGWLSMVTMIYGILIVVVVVVVVVANDGTIVAIDSKILHWV